MIIILFFREKKECLFKDFHSPFSYRERAILNETLCLYKWKMLYYILALNFTWFECTMKVTFSSMWNPKESMLMTFLNYAWFFLKENNNFTYFQNSCDSPKICYLMCLNFKSKNCISNIYPITSSLWEKNWTMTNFKGNFQDGEATESSPCLIYPRLCKTFNGREKNASLFLYFLPNTIILGKQPEQPCGG